MAVPDGSNLKSKADQWGIPPFLQTLLGIGSNDPTGINVGLGMARVGGNAIGQGLKALPAPVESSFKGGRYYHGSPSVYDKASTIGALETGNNGPAFYLTDDAERAGGYAVRDPSKPLYSNESGQLISDFSNTARGSQPNKYNNALSELQRYEQYAAEDTTESGKAFWQDEINRMKEVLANTEKEPPPLRTEFPDTWHPNVRPVDVSPDARIFVGEDIPSPETINRIRSAMTTQQQVAFDKYLKANSSHGVNNNIILNAVWDGAAGSKLERNRILSGSGYDGIAAYGEKPEYWQDTTLAMFPNRLGVVKNAYTKTPVGALAIAPFLGYLYAQSLKQQRSNQ